MSHAGQSPPPDINGTGLWTMASERCRNAVSVLWPCKFFAPVGTVRLGSRRGMATSYARRSRRRACQTIVSVISAERYCGDIRWDKTW